MGALDGKSMNNYMKRKYCYFFRNKKSIEPRLVVSCGWYFTSIVAIITNLCTGSKLWVSSHSFNQGMIRQISVIIWVKNDEWNGHVFVYPYTCATIIIWWFSLFIVDTVSYCCLCLQEYYSTAEPNPYSSETMMADPSRHGGVWGPWDWKSPTEDDQHCIGICNNYAINNRDKPDKQFNNDLESGWDKVTNWLVHYSRHLYVLI